MSFYENLSKIYYFYLTFMVQKKALNLIILYDEVITHADVGHLFRLHPKP